MNRIEFKVAFEKAQTKYPKIHMGLAWSFILTFEAMLRSNNEKPLHARHNFVFLIRLALNEKTITEKTDRTMYAALVGFLFGKRGHYVKSRKEKRGIRTTHTVPSYEIGTNEKGQLGWKL